MRLASKVFLLVVSAFLLLLSLPLNGVKISIAAKEQKVHVSLFGFQFDGPFDAGEHDVRFSFQNRFSTPQYLIEDQGYLQNGINLARCFLHDKECRERGFKLKSGENLNLLDFNPFRATLLISEQGDPLRFEMNVPDSSIEVWIGQKKIEAYKIPSPPLRIILAPSIFCLFLASLLVQIVLLFKRSGKGSSSDQIAAAAANPVTRNSRRWFWPALIFVAGSLLIGYVQLKIYKRMPGFGDEMNYLMQAKIFLSGNLSVPQPDMPEFFRVGWMDMFGADSKIWGFHPFGNSLIQMFGWLIGIYWITVPLLGGLILMLQFLFARELFGRMAYALAHVAIIASSHYFLSLTSSFMAHAPSLLFLSAFCYSLLLFHKYGKNRSLVAASLCIGIAFVIRPLSAVLVSAVPLLFLAFTLRLRKWPIAIFCCLLTVVLSALLFAYSWKISGHWTLPYLVKGPEVGQTLTARLAKSWDYRLINLYRNTNEFQTRIHSFGILLNSTIFFVPLFLLFSGPRRWYRVIGYLSFFFYLVTHSFLHWYGWKWEPRMIYDASFLFFLLSTDGLILLYEKLKTSVSMAFLAIIAFISVLGWTWYVDLPARFTTEYSNYVHAPSGVRDKLEEQGISNALVFFDTEMDYSSYTPFNSPTFDGPVVFAKSIALNADYRLISKFPEREVYYSMNGDDLKRRINFFRRDAKVLSRYLKRFDVKNILVVLPWLQNTLEAVRARVPGTKVDEQQFLQMLHDNSLLADGQPNLVLLIDQAAALSSLLEQTFQIQNIQQPALESDVKALLLLAPKSEVPEYLPGFKMTCFKGTDWKGPFDKTALVPRIAAEQCPGEYRSVLWDGLIAIEKEENVTFYLESDDGAGLFIDGQIIIDNDLFNEHGRKKRFQTIHMDKGQHSIHIKYINGPGPAFINVGVVGADQAEQPFSIDPGGRYAYHIGRNDF